MARANKCDRCNMLFEPNKPYNNYKDTYHDLVTRRVNYELILNTEKEIDLCPKCYESLMAWVEEGKEQK